MKDRKLERKSAWEQLRAAFSQLHDVAGVQPSSFELPTGWMARPVGADEVRARVGSHRFVLYNKAKNTFVDELPLSASATDLAVLAVDFDQASVGTAGFNYLQQKHALLVATFGDWYHRMWNDVKNAMKMTSNGLGLIWKATLQLILVRNISYQPFGSGEWFHELQEVVVDYMATRDANDPGFQEALPRLAASWGMASDTFEQQSLIFDRLADVASFNRKGVCIKLKRFMSIFEGFHFMRGDLPAIRLMLRHLLFLRGADQGACEQGEALPLQGMDHARDAKAELGKALKSKGTLRVAATLLHEKT